MSNTMLFHKSTPHQHIDLPSFQVSTFAAFRAALAWSMLVGTLMPQLGARSEDPDAVFVVG